MSISNTNSSSKSLAFIIEGRSRLLRYLTILLALFTVAFYCNQALYHTLALPLLRSLNGNQALIATGVTAPLFVPLKFAFFAAFVISLPALFYQIWRFVAPALYQHERNLLVWLVGGGVCLFYLGMAFAYFIVFPLIFHFFVALVPAHIRFMPDIGAYLSFTMQLFFAFGVIFEVPLLTLLLQKLRIVSYQQCVAARPYVIVSAFILGMILTPPDVISQILLAVPMCLLYELGLIGGRVLGYGTKQSPAKSGG